MIKTQDYIRDAVTIFFSQRKIILWTTALIAFSSILIAFFWPPIYAASGSILVKGKKVEKSLEALEKEEIRSFPVSREDLSSEVEILTSHDVIERTVNYLKERSLHPEKKGDITFLNKTVYKIKSNIKTKIVPASNVIEITFYDNDPKDAAIILEALMNQYILYWTQVYYPSQTESFFARQANKFKKSLEKREDELMDLVKKTKMSDPQKEIENNIQIKKDLEHQLNLLKNEAIGKKIYIEHVEKALSDGNMQFFTSLGDVPINNPDGLSIKLQELFVERGNILRVYHPLSEKVKSIDKQINDIHTALKAEIRAYKDNQASQLMAINKKISLIESKLAKLNDRNVELQRQLIESERIARETALLKYSYETFYKRREESKIYSTADGSNLSPYISILSKAFPSDGPVFPKKNVFIPMGILVGFITGCSFGFLRNYFDHTFKIPSDVHNYAGLPLIFSVPDWNKEGPKKVSIKPILGALFGLILLLGALSRWGLQSDTSPLFSEDKEAIEETSDQPSLAGKTLQEVRVEQPHSLGHKNEEMVKEANSPKSFNQRKSERKPLAQVSKELPQKDSNEIISKGKETEPFSKNHPKEMSPKPALPQIQKSIVIYDKQQRRYYLQVHSCKDKEIAMKEAEKLRNAGYPSSVKSVKINQYGLTHRVLLGPFNQKKEAYEVQAKPFATGNR
jgi:uncharacterized protein involved in exopolysaccharide biosynthesis/cell division septation protein DedD